MKQLIVNQINPQTTLPDEQQLQSHNSIFSKIEQEVINGRTPVIEVDVDLTALKPVSRTIKALYTTGDYYNIKEFKSPESHFDLLPGYTKSAWINFLVRNKLPERYPALRWVGPMDGVGENSSVYSYFYKSFWTNGWLIEDTVTGGLNRWVKKIEKLGGVVVFLSQRWLPEQVEAAINVLKEAGIASPCLINGSINFLDSDPVQSAEFMALKQQEIWDSYGKPVAIIDDQLINREAVIIANDNQDILSVDINLREFTRGQIRLKPGLRIMDFRI